MTTEHKLAIVITSEDKASPALGKLGQLLANLGGKALKSLPGIASLGGGVTSLAVGSSELGATLVTSVAKIGFGAVTGAATGVIGVLKGVATGALAVTAALGAVTSALQASAAACVPYATQLEGIKRAYLGIAGEGAPAMLKALKSSSAYMVEDLKLLRSYNAAYTLVGDHMTERLPEAYQYMAKVAVATGQDVTQLLDTLVKGVGRLSYRWMAHTGVVVTGAEATLYATQMFNKEADALTRVEKQTAFLDLALKRLEARTSNMPEVLNTTRQMSEALRAKFKDLAGEWGTHFLPVARAVYDILATVVTRVSELISKGGALYPVIRTVAATLTVMGEELLKVVQAALGFSEAEDAIDSFANKIISMAWDAIEWGANIATNFAIGIVQGASTALISAMDFIAGLLTYWLAPGSAPAILPDLFEWGGETFTEWLRGFSSAQFDVLEGVQAPLKRALAVLEGLEVITPLEGADYFIDLTVKMTEALTEFWETGVVSQDVLSDLAAIGGDYGEALADLYRQQLDLASAVEWLAAAEERLNAAREREIETDEALSQAAREYNKLIREGADPAVLAAKMAEVEASYEALRLARDEVEQAEDQVEQAEDLVEQRETEVSLTERLLQQLIELGQAQIDYKDAVEDAADIDEIDPIEWPDINVIPIDNAFDELKERIRQKFADLWDEIATLWEESGAAQALEDLRTRWDAFYAESIEPALAKLNEYWATFKAWLEDDAWPWILTKWEEWKAWWEENGPIITAALGTLYTEVTTWAEENIFQWAIDEWDKWKKWWDEEGPIMQLAAEGVFVGIGVALDLLLAQFGTSLDELWTWLDGEGGWESLVAATVIAWETGVETMKTAASGGMQFIRLELSAGLRLLIGDVEGSKEQHRSAWLVFWQTADDVTFGAVTALAKWLDEEIKYWVTLLPELFDWTLQTPSIITNLVTAFTTELWRLKDIGFGIVESIVEGITNKAGTLFDALTQLARDAIAEAEEALGFGSPSRVFLEMGRGVAESFAMGAGATLSDPVAVGTAAVAPVSIVGRGAGASVGPQYEINNYFGKDSVRSEADVMEIAEQINSSMMLRGSRATVV